jgi:hypothetical protein
MGDDFPLRSMSCQNLVREIFDVSNVHLMKVTIERSALTDGNSRTSVPNVWRKSHEEDTCVFLGSGDSGRGEELSDEAPPGLPCQINLDTLWRTSWSWIRTVRHASRLFRCVFLHKQ